jgi:hypothetical protein
MLYTPAELPASGGSNTQANAILEVTIPEVDIAPGEGLELGVSSELPYVDGPASVAPQELPCT